MQASETPKLEKFSIWDEITSCTTLPSPPGVAVELVNLAQHPDTQFEQVEQVVQLDPAISAKLLRLANSSFYARSCKIENLSQAIGLFGLNGTLTIALTFSLISTPDDNKSGLDHNQFWLRSLATGIICKKLTKLLHRSDKETFYLAGLLQDIGILVLNQIRPGLYDSSNETPSNHQSLIESELNLMGLDHSVIGAWLLEEWQFPDVFVTATANSHKLTETTADRDSTDLCACVALASSLAEFWSQSEAALPPEMKSTIVDELGLTDDNIQKLIEETQKEISEVSPLFDVSEVTDAAISSLLRDATEGITIRTLMSGVTLSDSQSRVAELTNQTQNLETEATHLKRKLDFDDLTNVHTRGYALDVLEKYIKNTNDCYFTVSLLFVDLDDFKSINDKYGHSVGDNILKSAAQILKSVVRETDVVARYGGEEFLVILCNAGYEHATNVCDRLISTLAQSSIRVDSHRQVSITASVGLSVHGEKSVYQDVTEFIDTADAACYRAKNTGKNRWLPCLVPE